jgi:hypothetical protein
MNICDNPQGHPIPTELPAFGTVIHWASSWGTPTQECRNVGIILTAEWNGDHDSPHASIMGEAYLFPRRGIREPGKTYAYVLQSRSAWHIAERQIAESNG